MKQILNRKRKWSGTLPIHSNNVEALKREGWTADRQPARFQTCLGVETTLRPKVLASRTSRVRRHLSAQQTAAISALDITAAQTQLVRHRTLLRRGKPRARPTPGQLRVEDLEVG